MASRATPEQPPKSVRLDFKINLENHPDIAELYLANPRRFSTTTVEALALYSLIVKKTGVVGLANAANAIAIGVGVCAAPQAASAPMPVLASGDRSPEAKIDLGGVAAHGASNGKLSSSAAEALLSMDRDM